MALIGGDRRTLTFDVAGMRITVEGVPASIDPLAVQVDLHLHPEPEQVDALRDALAGELVELPPSRWHEAETHDEQTGRARLRAFLHNPQIPTERQSRG